MFAGMVENALDGEPGEAGTGEPVTVNIGELDIAKKGKKTKKTKKNGTVNKKRKKLDTISEPSGSYTFSKFSSNIIKNTDLTAVSIKDTLIPLKLSWYDLLVTLVGTVIKNTDDVIDTIVTAGIANEGVKVVYEIRDYSMYELDHYKILRIPDTNYYLEIEEENYDAIHSSITNCIKYFGFKDREVSVSLINKELASQIQENEDSEDSENNEFVRSSLYDICGDYDIVPIITNYVEYLGTTMEVDTFINVVLLLLVYFSTIFDKDETIKIMKDASIKDACGITDNRYDYMGHLTTIEIPNMGLYFYYNGYCDDLKKFISKVCEKLKIDMKSIIISYKV